MNSIEHVVVSIIVPARNEESCLAFCLESLVTQTGVPFELIVVDDASTDRTAEIARSFADHVISAPSLPDNWTGKNNAMSAGAKIATGKWLLFTDADTVHRPGSLARAVAEAEEHGVALLSYSPEQEAGSFLEKAVMPVIFAELATTYPPAKVRDPNSPIAAANGQYLMISREAYDGVGAHTKIASDLLEDVAMARLVKGSGRKIWFRYGGDAVRTRMYRTWSQMKEGWTKNLALLFKNPRELAFVRLATFVALLGTAGVTLRFIFSKHASVPTGALVTGLLSLGQHHEPLKAIAWFHLVFDLLNGLGFFLLAGYLLKRTRNAGFSWRTALVSPLGLPLFAYLLLRSRRAYKSARFDWKDRSYVYSAEQVSKMAHSLPAEETSMWRKLLTRITH